LIVRIGVFKVKSPTAAFVYLGLLAFCPQLLAQQATSGAIGELKNESVIKLLKAGLSADLIVSTSNALPGTYDTSPEGLISLKGANASDRVVSAIVLKASSSAPTTKPPADQELAQKALPVQETGHTVSLVPAVAPQNAESSPRVFLQSASKGTNRNAARDQSMEMSKDLEKDCPGVRVTIIQQAADYTVLLNHIEVGFARDNQIQVANKDGDLISKTKEGGTIAGGLKKACALILADWAKK
jgi:hypothetical protein